MIPPELLHLFRLSIRNVLRHILHTLRSVETCWLQCGMLPGLQGPPLGGTACLTLPV